MIGATRRPDGKTGPVARAVTQTIRLQAIADQDGTSADFQRTWPVLAHFTNAGYTRHVEHTHREERARRAACD